MTTQLQRYKAIAISQSSSYDENVANAMFLWCINTGELYHTFLKLVERYEDSIIDLVRNINCVCLDQRQALGKAEPDLGVINRDSCKIAAILIAEYYLDIHHD